MDARSCAGLPRFGCLRSRLRIFVSGQGAFGGFCDGRHSAILGPGSANRSDAALPPTTRCRAATCPGGPPSAGRRSAHAAESRVARQPGSRNGPAICPGSAARGDAATPCATVRTGVGWAPVDPAATGVSPLRWSAAGRRWGQRASAQPVGVRSFGTIKATVFSYRIIAFLL